MTDTPGREPEGRRARAAPARRPPTGRGGAGRAVHLATVDPQDRFHAGTGCPGRSSVGERTLGRLPRVGRHHPVHLAVLVLRARHPGRAHDRASGHGDRRPAGRQGRARLPDLRGELRALPRPGRRGGEGPTLNRQDKLFSHLNEDYIRNVLTVGGGYVCGNPQSKMPIWSDTGNPPGRSTIARSRSSSRSCSRPTTRRTSSATSICSTPKKDPITGQVMTFTGWRDPNYKPDPGRRPSRTATSTSSRAASASPARPPRSTRMPVVDISTSIEQRLRPEHGDRARRPRPSSSISLNNENGVPAQRPGQGRGRAASLGATSSPASPRRLQRPGARRR